MTRNFILIQSIVVSLAILSSSCSKSKSSDQSPKEDTGVHSPHSHRKRRIANDERNNSPGTNSKGTQYNAGFKEELLATLMEQWDTAAAESKGDDLLHKQWEIEKRIASLGYGDSLEKFIDFLEKNGDVVTMDRVISELGNSIFSGSGAGAARKWLLGLENKELREKLCRYAGKYHPAEGLNEYISAFAPDVGCQAAILTAYCKQLALVEPMEAVRSFVDFRPPEVTFSGLQEVMTVLPPTADFAAISDTLPPDSKNIAKRVRSALLRSWVASKPEGAAQYVVSNPSQASPDQMKVVTESWCRKSPDDAGAWIEAHATGIYKDAGFVTLSEYWMRLDPAKAWKFASGVNQRELRVTIATGVFKAWELSDRDAATKAWLTLFPPQQ